MFHEILKCTQFVFITEIVCICKQNCRKMHRMYQSTENQLKCVLLWKKHELDYLQDFAQTISESKKAFMSGKAKMMTKMHFKMEFFLLEEAFFASWIIACTVSVYV